MIDLREYFYNKIKNEMDHWDWTKAGWVRQGKKP